MTGRARRRPGVVRRATMLLLLAAAPCGSAAARPMRVDDILRLEGYGQMAFSPDGRLALFERRARYDRAAYYGFGFFTRRLLTHIYALDVRAPAHAAPLFAQAADAGYWLAGFSPSGRRLAIFRITQDALALGILDLADRHVRWLPLAPDLPPANPRPIWLDDDRLLVAYRADGRLPMPFAQDRAIQSLGRLWQAARLGRTPSGSWVGDSVGATAGGLALVEANTGHVHPLWTHGALFDVSLAPDRKHVAIVGLGPPAIPDPDTVLDPGFADRRLPLTLGSLGGPWWQAMANVRPGLLSWRADGRALLVYRASSGDRSMKGGFARVDTSDHSVRSLAPVALAAAPDADGAVRLQAGWLGRTPIAKTEDRQGRSCWLELDHAVRRRLACLAGRSILLRIGPRALALAGPDGLVSVPPTGRAHLEAAGPATPLAALDPFALGLRTAADPDPGAPLAVVTGHGPRWLRFDLYRPETLALGADDDAVVAASAASRAALVLRRTTAATTLALVRADRRTVIVDRINAHLRDVAVPRLVRLEARMSDGRVHAHWLILPATARHRLPLIVVPYPGRLHDDGPPAIAADQPAAISLPLLVAHGYAALVPGLPADSGTAQGLDRVARDVARAVAAIPATAPVDTARAAVWGHSYGGYGALAIAAESRAFRAIICADGIADFASNYGALPPYDRVDLADGLPLASIAGWSEGGQARLRRAPWRRPETYRRASPFYAVTAMHTPLLLISGDQDYVPVEQAEHLYVALRRLGRPVALLRYWGEGHVLASPANIADAYRRVFAWLAERLAAPSGRQIPSPGASARRRHRQ